MKMYFCEGGCNYCLKNKKVLKFGSPTDMRGLCRKCLEELSKNPNLK